MRMRAATVAQRRQRTGNRGRGDRLGLDHAGLTPTELATGLVVPGLDQTRLLTGALMPVLPEVVVGDNVVVLHHLEMPVLLRKGPPRRDRLQIPARWRPATTGVVAPVRVRVRALPRRVTTCTHQHAEGDQRHSPSASVHGRTPRVSSPPPPGAPPHYRGGDAAPAHHH